MILFGYFFNQKVARVTKASQKLVSFMTHVLNNWKQIIIIKL